MDRFTEVGGWIHKNWLCFVNKCLIHDENKIPKCVQKLPSLDGWQRCRNPMLKVIGLQC
jgi:hypothetical protein